MSDDVTHTAPASVVLIDDEPELRALVAATLHRTERYDVIGEGGDGASGLELATRLRPDVVLLDIRLPDIDGRELVPSLVAAAPTSMVVALSGLHPAEAAAQALAAGAFAYVQKTSMEQLADRLDVLLEQFRRALSGEDVVAPSAVAERR